MEGFIYVFVQIVYIFLLVAQLLMLLRVIFSIFIMDEENPLAKFLYYATEPLVYPLRLLFKKIGTFDDFILDIPFMATMLMIVLVQSALPTVYL